MVLLSLWAEYARGDFPGSIKEGVPGWQPRRQKNLHLKKIVLPRQHERLEKGLQATILRV